jgi:hypothetical protein
MSNTISFDKEVLKELKAEYNKSVENKIEVFNFKGNELLTDYAKYLIEFLESKFGK